MPSKGQGPRLRLYGPDKRHGATPRRGFRRYLWYILWYENHQKYERATGLDERASLAEREAALATFIHDRTRAPGSPRNPHTVLIADVLASYTDGHLVHVIGKETAARAVINLVSWWQERSVADISAQTCRQYVAERHISDGSGRRELGVLQAAINWCHREGILSSPVPVWHPNPPPPCDRWLTRQEAAQLLSAARHASSWYLSVFILLGLYTGARKDAILGLQWIPNLGGGHVNLDRGVIDYRRSGTAQTNKRRCAIPIHPRLRLHLEYARKRTETHVLEYRGKRILNLKKGFAACVTRAGLEDVTPHTLRHTAVTWLVQAGIPLWEVSQWVGLSIRMIETTYGHHAPDRFNRIMAAKCG